ncbi:MAG: aquaporin [Longimicrobiales bacterium]
MQLRKLVVEAIGTFFLVLTIGMTIIDPGAGALAPLAIGAVLIVMVYAGGHISGAHYNPAVTLAVFIRGKATKADVFGYWGAQIAGAALAAFIVNGFKAGVLVATAPVNTVPALLAEFLFTFALAYVVLNVATTRGTEGNSYYGAAIGFTVMAGAFAVGPVSGAVFNPAVAVGVTIMGLFAVSDIWVFLVANFLGAACAGLLFNVFDLGNDKPTTAAVADQGKLRQAAATK